MTIVAIVCAFALISNASAQTGVEITDSSASSDFPDGLSFTMTVEAPGEVDEVRLIYEIAPDGVQATAVPDCTTGAVSTCRYDVGGSEGTILIPGAEVTYFWRVTAGDETFESEPQSVTYEDTRFEWQTLSEGNLTVWYYNGDEDEARGILTAGRESLDSVGALLGTTVDFPVKIFYYDTAAEMQEAIISAPGEGVVTRGEVVYSDTAMVSADSAAGDITRHEIAHIVVRQAVGGPFGVPDWLNEGTAVYAQTEPLGHQQTALDAAIESGQALSVRSLSSFSSGAGAGQVSLFYGQSYSIVNFLIETYGEEKFAELFAAFREGNSTADALMAVYGFDQDGLENEWRASVGLPPRSVPSPVNVDEPAPTEEPEPDAASGSDDDSVVVIVLVVAITAVIAAGLAAVGLILARRFG